MPYFVLIGGGIAIVFIWLNYAKKKGSGESGSRLVMSLIGSGAIVWAMWGWGVQAIQEQNEQAAEEQNWLATFADQHRRAWDEDCRAILTSLGAQGVIYDPKTGVGYTLSYCQSMWSPPKQPLEYSPSKDDQPESTPPFPSSALFGPNVSEIRCVDQALTECYEWIDFRGGPG